MNLYFWHNLISPHQAPFMRELAERGHQVMVVATEAMSEERRKLGWTVPSLGKAQVVVAPDEKQVLQMVKSSPPDSIHFIAGARGTALGQQVARACRASGRSMGIITESPDPRGIGGLLRRAKYAGERFTMGRHFDFILAMGEKGVHWFRQSGYPEVRLFPFAYVTDRLPHEARAESHDAFRFIFVGRLIPLKGLDLLLKALAKVTHAELSIIGDGPEKERLQGLARELGITDRVFWLGQMETAQAQARIIHADVLVLPSRKDGWGSVVNESLMAGTPVICSTACGAAELIRHPWLGTVFPENQVAALAEAMAQWCARGKISPEQRQRVRTWAQCIEAPCVARYVEDVLTHVYEQGPRPQAPWRS